MGFVSEELNETERQLIKGGKAGNMAVVYGKEASIWKVSTRCPSPPPHPAGSRPGRQPAWGLRPCCPPHPHSCNQLKRSLSRTVT